MNLVSAGEAEHLMRRAIALAKRGNGMTHPNPCVGALIVEEGKIVAEGWHRRAGTPHAERVVLSALGRKPHSGATLFVTLEPCSTHGNTGACTTAIIEAGISRVFVGAIDPNPAHAGNGLSVLRAAGIEVVSGILERECENLNSIFNHWILEKKPLFAAKIAQTLDGRTATRSGESKWITNSCSRDDVMRLRRYFPAIATGSGTVLSDNPSLTARIPDEMPFCPIRFIFDRRLRTLEHLDRLQVFNDEFCNKTIIVTTTSIPEEKTKILVERGIGIWTLGECDFWATFRSRCTEENLCGVLFEAGSELLGRLFSERQIDYLYSYVAPKLFGDPVARPMFTGTALDSLADARTLKNPSCTRLGDDFLFEGQLI